MVLQNFNTKSLLSNGSIFGVRIKKGGIKKMIHENVENAKADAKKGMADIENKMSHLKADAKADVGKVKANFGHSKAEKKEAYANADITANAEKAKADVKNRITHLEADAEKMNTDYGKKTADALK
jgi:hypothetical protein